MPYSTTLIATHVAFERITGELPPKFVNERIRHLCQKNNKPIMMQDPLHSFVKGLHDLIIPMDHVLEHGLTPHVSAHDTFFHATGEKFNPAINNMLRERKIVYFADRKPKIYDEMDKWNMVSAFRLNREIFNMQTLAASHNSTAILTFSEANYLMELADDIDTTLGKTGPKL